MLKRIIILLFTLYFLHFPIKWFLADFLYNQSLKNQNKDLALAAFKLYSSPHYAIQVAKLSGSTDKKQPLSYINYAITTSPGEINYYKIASQVLDPKLSLEVLKKAQKKAPTDPVLVYQIANIYYQQQDLNSAIFYYQEAIKLKPNYDLAMLKLARIYLEQKNIPESRKYANSAAEINPKNITENPDLYPSLN